MNTRQQYQTACRELRMFMKLDGIGYHRTAQQRLVRAAKLIETPVFNAAIKSIHSYRSRHMENAALTYSDAVMTDEVSRLNAEIDALKAENERLRATLQPFASCQLFINAAQVAFGYVPKDETTLHGAMNSDHLNRTLHAINLGHIRAAAKALAGE